MPNNLKDAMTLDPRYRVGIPQVDREHQRLFEIIAEVNKGLDHADDAARGAALRRVIGELIEYTRSHFASEEALMTNAGFPSLATHRLLHGELLKRVREMQMRIEIGDESATLDLSRFLASWLTEHILTADREFGRFVASRPPA
jgi:hemerythrin